MGVYAGGCLCRQVVGQVGVYAGGWLGRWVFMQVGVHASGWADSWVYIVILKVQFDHDNPQEVRDNASEQQITRSIERDRESERQRQRQRQSMCVLVVDCVVRTPGHVSSAHNLKAVICQVVTEMTTSAYYISVFSVMYDMICRFSLTKAFSL